MFGDMFLVVGGCYIAYSGYWLLQNSRKILCKFDLVGVIEECEKVIFLHIKSIVTYSLLMLINYYLIGIQGSLFSHIFSLCVLIAFVLLKYLSIIGVVDSLHRYTVSATSNLNIFSSIIFYAIKNSLLFIISLYIICIWSDIFNFTASITLALPMFMFSYKFVGNILTKIGDVIADYKTKIKEEGEEDKGDSYFSTIDNVGDIVGDAFGTFTDYLIVATFLLFSCFKLNPYLQIRECMIGVAGKIILIFLQVILASVVFNAKKVMKFMDLIFIVNVLGWTGLDAVRRSKILFGDLSGFNTLLFEELNSVAYMLFFMAIMFVINMFKTYNCLAESITEFMKKNSVYGLPLVITISFLFATVLDMISSIFLGILPAKPALGSILIFQSFTIFAVYYVFKTDFGVIIDSSCGIYKRYIDQNYSDKSDKTKQIEEKLDQLDEDGNIFKLESKLFLYAVVFWILKGMKIELFSKFIDSLVILVALPVFIFSYHLYQAMSSVTDLNKLTNLIARSGIIFFVSLTFGYIEMFQIHGLMKRDIALIAVRLLFLSKAMTIIGSFFDIIKKHNEVRKTNLEKRVKLELIKNDLLGDFLKDVFGPTLFSIALYTSLIVYIFLSEYNFIKVV